MVWMHKCVPWDKRLSLSGVHFSQVCEMRLYGRPHGKAGRARRFPLRLLSSSTPQAAPAVSFTPDEPCFLSCVFPSRPTASSRIGSASPSLASSQSPSAHGCCRTDALQLSGFRPRPRPASPLSPDACIRWRISLPPSAPSLWKTETFLPHTANHTILLLMGLRGFLWGTGALFPSGFLSLPRLLACPRPHRTLSAHGAVCLLTSLSLPCAHLLHESSSLD